MRKLWITLLILGFSSFLATTRAAVATTTPTASSPPPGQQIAQTLSLITGVAISPLMGVGAVGAWQWWEAKTPEQKSRLPWYGHPLFWAPYALVGDGGK